MNTMIFLGYQHSHCYRFGSQGHKFEELRLAKENTSLEFVPAGHIGICSSIEICRTEAQARSRIMLLEDSDFIQWPLEDGIQN